jgi:hypothetical protein
MSNLTFAAAKNAAAGTLFTGPATIRGWSLRALTAMVLRLHDGTSGTGVFLAEVALAAGVTETVMDPAGIHAQNGVFLELVSGTVEGCVYIA